MRSHCHLQPSATVKLVLPSAPAPATGRTPASVAKLGIILTHDFCPWANRYVHWLKHPLFVLTLAALVSLAIGMSVAHQGYVAFGGIVTVLLLGVLWPWIGMLGLRASLRFERRRAREGDRVAAILTVTNRMPWPAWGLVLERGFVPVGESTGQVLATSDSAGVTLALARVPGFSQSDFRWDFEPPCRGDYPLAVPLLTTSFPFGLWTRQRRVEVASRLLVWPRIVPLEALPLEQGTSWTLGALSPRRSGHEGEVIGTRLYRPGDLLRHVHWAQTARQGQMIVCERQASLTSSVRVVIDGSAAAHVGCGPNSLLEWTLRVAASVCHSLLDHDARLLVQLGDSLLDIAPGGKGEERLNDALARFQPAVSILAEMRPETSHRPRRATKSRQRSNELEIVVTTDRAAADWSLDGIYNRRIIVLNAQNEITAGANHSKQSSGIWFALDSGGDVAVQLQDSWERACRNEWCAAQ